MPSLEFKGKQFVYAHHLSVPFRQLDVVADKSLPKEGAAPSTDDNLIIHGDNLHALKALLPQYAGKVKCIFIDPPYNTGDEGWCYNDKVNSPLMQEWLKKSANPVDKEDLERHDKWLCMMWPRLQLLRELLSDDGLIFVTLDDNEVHRLKSIMEEVFGEDNFIGDVIWKKTSGDNKPAFAFTHDNILIFSKNKQGLPRVKLSEEQEKQYKNPDNDSKGRWAESDYRSKWNKTQRPNLYYAVTNPNTGEEIYPDTHSDSLRVWGCSEETHQKNERDGLVWWGEDGCSKEPKKKRYLSEHKGANTRSVWLDAGSNDEASTLLYTVLGHKDFDNPKPIKLIKKIVSLYFQEDALVLDSFAGSGTTAHAVLALNKEDGGNRKFILVECEDYADNITAERVRRVIKGVPDAKDVALKEGLGGSFAFCELGQEMNIENLLSGGDLPSYEELARYAFYTATGLTLDAIKTGADYFIGETDSYRAYLIYKPELTFLRSGDSAFNMPLAQSIAESCKAAGKAGLVFATHKFMGQKELTEMGITYCQLPYAIHRVMGD